MPRGVPGRSPALDAYLQRHAAPAPPGSWDGRVCDDRGRDLCRADLRPAPRFATGSGGSHSVQAGGPADRGERFDDGFGTSSGTIDTDVGPGLYRWQGTG